MPGFFFLTPKKKSAQKSRGCQCTKTMHLEHKVKNLEVRIDDKEKTRKGVTTGAKKAG